MLKTATLDSIDDAFAKADNYAFLKAFEALDMYSFLPETVQVVLNIV
jgi:hypothetical protein